VLFATIQSVGRNCLRWIGITPAYPAPRARKEVGCAMTRGSLGEPRIRCSQARHSRRLSTTNYSLVPLEMMACNLPVVEIDTESPRAIFKEGEVSFAAPDPGKIADAIEELTRNAGLLARQQEKARNFVSGLS
jgi:hypothetical protein